MQNPSLGELRLTWWSAWALTLIYWTVKGRKAMGVVPWDALHLLGVLDRSIPEMGYELVWIINERDVRENRISFPIII